MRRGNSPDWVYDGHHLVGVFTSSDSCAEHEWGIKDLRHAIGATEEPGIERRRVRKTDSVAYVERDGMAMLRISSSEWSIGKFKEYAGPLDKLYHDLTLFSERTLCTAWCESDVGILVKGKENIARLTQIYDAIIRNDGALVRGGAKIPVFDNGGITLAIVSRIPAAQLKQLMDGDNDHAKLKAADAATGIQERLKKAGLEYLACSARWAGKDEKKRTKHPVTYWLNPMRQDRVNYGQFTVEELDQWIAGTGPIPMTEAQKKQHARRR